MAAAKPDGAAARDDDLPEPFRIATGERVTGQGVTGEAVEQPGPYSVTAPPAQGPRIALSVTRIERAKAWHP